MRDPEARATLDLRHQAARINHSADVANRDEINERDTTGLDVNFHFGESDDETVRHAVARIGVFRHAHQTEPRQRGSRLARHRVDVFRQLVSVEAAARAMARRAASAKLSHSRDCHA